MADCSKIRRFRDAEDYRKNFIVQSEIDKYLPGGRHFIDEARIARCIAEIAEKPADPVQVREILAKSEATCETLRPEETAVLMSASADPALFAEDHVVDPVSMAVSLRDCPDERVQGEVEGFMEAHQW